MVIRIRRLTVILLLAQCALMTLALSLGCHLLDLTVGKWIFAALTALHLHTAFTLPKPEHGGLR